MSSLAFERLAKSYGGVDVVREVSLRIEQGEFVSLLGPSGCGKTTILRMAAGLVAPSRGRILIGEEDVTALPPNRRDLGLVFQSYALFPHLTVFENVAFGLRRKRTSPAEMQARVAEALAMVRLAAFGDRYPRQLSGGQQQRVAIARALAPRPRVLLLDEPLSNLDAQLRDEMQFELKRLQRGLGVTTLLVTHDQGEALSLSDKLCVMAHGVMQQFGPPEDIYRRPATSFVAGFIGRPNRLKGVVVTRRGGGGLLRIANGLMVEAGHVEVEEGGDAEIVIRPEAIGLAVRTRAEGEFAGRVVLRSFAGARAQVLARLDGGPELVIDLPSAALPDELAPDAPVAVSISPSGVFALSGRTA